MRFLVIIVTLVHLNFEGHSQPGILYNNNRKVTLNVLSYNKEVRDENDLKFVLRLKNMSGDKIMVPEKFSVFAKNLAAGNVAYEVLFCEKNDTLDFTDLIIANADDFGKRHDRFLLDNDSSLLFNAHPHSLYFWKEGVYKIRFFLKDDNLYSEWVFLKVYECVWPPVKEGHTPVMRKRS